LVMSLLNRFLAEKPFEVDYNRPYSDVTRDFVRFSIEQTHKSDPTQALDILCRPWALEAPKGRSAWLGLKKILPETGASNRLLDPPRDKWYKRKLVIQQSPAEEPWEENDRFFRYRYDPDVSPPKWEEDQRPNDAYRKTTEWIQPCGKKGCPHDGDPSCEEIKWEPSPGWERIRDRYFPTNPDDINDVELPTWVAQASRAPFTLDNTPGMEMSKTSRANADPLVGPPQDGHRNYNAAGPEKLNLQNLEFRKRPVMGHYSLYLRGFELDVVKTVTDASQLGSIPTSWLALADWKDLSKDPPDEFWRTIVADRGRNNQNPPYYYARACKESVHKGGHRGGSVNTGALIHDEKNSIVAEFCRRVHAVIWNRSLFKTEAGRLGLGSKVKEGDRVCILYGCTVPVILRQKEKKMRRSEDGMTDLDREAEEDRVELLKAVIRRAIAKRDRKGKYRSMKKKRVEKGWDLQALEDARRECLKDREQERTEASKSATERAYTKARAADKKETEKRLARTVMEAIQQQKTAKQDLDAATKRKKEAEEERKKASMAHQRVQIGAGASGSSGATSPEDAKGSVDDATAAAMERSNKAADQVREAEEAIQAAEYAMQEAIEKRETAERQAEEVAERAAFPPDPDPTQVIRTPNIGSGGLGIGFSRAATGRSRGSRVDSLTPASLPRADTEAWTEASVAAGPRASVGGEGSPGSPGVGSTASQADTSSKTESVEEWERYWYELVGECYLHGMMDGEAMREKFYDDSKKDKTFELR